MKDEEEKREGDDHSVNSSFLLKDPHCYERAWELSGQRSARAQRSLGLYYLRREKVVAELLDVWLIDSFSLSPPVPGEYGMPAEVPEHQLTAGMVGTASPSSSSFSYPVTASGGTMVQFGLCCQCTW